MGYGEKGFSEPQRLAAKRALMMTDSELAAIPKEQREVLMKFRTAPEYATLRKQVRQKPVRKKMKPGTQLKI